MKRMRKCQQALGVSYVEFIHDATVNAIEECESVLTDAYRRPLTGRELDTMHKSLVEAGASAEFTLAWLRREIDRWTAPSVVSGL
jgi:hypothetical protein